jgi:rhamnosyl/mannosyltransferase
MRHEAEMIRARYGENLMLFAGRLVYYKGLQYLIAAMPLVRGKLLIVGDGPLRGRLERQARELGVAERVSFLGRLSDRQLRVVYHACDVFVLPSTHSSEGFGIVQLEAMACRKPVVNTRLRTGVPYVSLDGVTGLTVEPANSGVLAEALNTLLADPELRRVYGENGRARVLQEFTVQLMAERIMRVYGEVLGA